MRTVPTKQRRPTPFLTSDEKRAISSLQRLAKKWPRSLWLVHHADSRWIKIKKPDLTYDEIADEPTLAEIDIPIESCV